MNIRHMFPQKHFDARDLRDMIGEEITAVTIEKVDFKTKQSKDFGDAKADWFLFVEELAKPIKISPTAKRRFKGRIRVLTNRNRGISFARYLEEVNAYARGWAQYFGLAEVWRDWRTWDEWIRRRLRLVLLKQWKTARRRLRNLMKLGATRHQASAISRSGKGLWRLSRTKTLNQVLDVRWFEAQGLLRLDTLWWTLAPLR